MNQDRSPDTQPENILPEEKRKLIEQCAQSEYFNFLATKSVKQIIKDWFRSRLKYILTISSLVTLIFGWGIENFLDSFEEAQNKVADLTQQTDSLQAKLAEVDSLHAQMQAVKAALTADYDEIRQSIRDFKITRYQIESDLINEAQRIDQISYRARGQLTNLSTSMDSLARETAELSFKGDSLIGRMREEIEGIDSTVTEKFGQKIEKVSSFPVRHLWVKYGSQAPLSPEYRPAYLTLPHDTLEVTYYGFATVPSDSMVNKKLFWVIPTGQKPARRNVAVLDIYHNNEICFTDSLKEGDIYQCIGQTDYQVRAVKIEKDRATLEFSLRQ